MTGAPFGECIPGNAWERLDGVSPLEPRSVSVIVVHYEQPTPLARTLAALERQRYPADRLEVIVVDDGSERPPDVPAGVRLLRQERDGARRAAARNRGARAASGEILLFLDADTAPEPDYVERLVRLPSLAPEAVVVGRRRHARFDGVAIDVGVEVAGPVHELADPAWLRDGYAATRNLRDADGRAFRYVISAVLGCSRWLFDELNGFLEAFVDYGGEDWEWAHRAWLSGAVFAHVPDAVAWHDGPDWAGRDPAAAMNSDAGAARRQQKNAEAMRLARVVTADGHRARGLVGRRAETVVELAGDPSAAAAFVCVDALLAALPRAAVRVPDALYPDLAGDPRVIGRGDAGAEDGSEVTERLRWPSLHLVVHAPVRTVGSGLAELCDALVAGDAEAETGRRRLVDAGGTLLTLETARYRARAAHWGPSGSDGPPAADGALRPSWLERLPPVPDVEAHLGGWG